MSVETAFDRQAFVNPAEFGVSVTYRRRDHSPGDTDFNGVLDIETDEAQAEGGGIRVQASSPMMTARTTDLPNGGRYDDLIVIPLASLTAAELPVEYAGEWRVVGVRPDGSGFTVMMLERQATTP